jgi:enamine deaminase RidA (YjgF/YER057c/UK114 family)
VKAAFAKIDKSLQASGAKLTDIVQLSIFLTDMRYQPQFAKIAQGMFKGGYPAITYIEVSHMADPQLLIEIQPIAVIP